MSIIDITRLNYNIQLTLEQQRFEMCGFIYTWILKGKYKFGFLYSPVFYPWIQTISDWKQSFLSVTKVAYRFLTLQHLVTQTLHCSRVSQLYTLCQDHIQNLIKIRFVSLFIKMLQRAKDWIYTGYALCHQWEKARIK